MCLVSVVACNIPQRRDPQELRCRKNSCDLHVTDNNADAYSIKWVLEGMSNVAVYMYI